MSLDIRMKILWVACLCLASSFLFAADYEISAANHVVSVESDSFATEHHTETVKIMNEEGIGYKKLIPVNPYIQVTNIRGTVTFPDGHSAPIKREHIVELPWSGGSETMTDLKVIAILPQALEKGCSVTIDYDRSITSLLYLDPWVYAGYSPIKNTHYSISYPNRVPIKYLANDDSIVPKKTEMGDKTTLVFESAAFGEVSVIGQTQDLEDVQRSVEFVPLKCMTDKYPLSTETWGAVAQWYSDVSKFAGQWDPALDPIVQEAQSGSKSPEDVAEALYRYIQKNYAYTAVEVGIGGFKPRFAKQTFGNKYGDCKDLAFLYVTLVRKAGIEAYPALISTHSPRLFRSNFPSPLQFNHCIAYLPKIKNGTWVDCTVKSFKFGEIPAEDQGKYSLIAGGPNDLVQVPDNRRTANVMKITLNGVLADKEIHWTGTMEATGIPAEIMEMVKTAVNRNSSRFFAIQQLMAPDVPLQKLETSQVAERSMNIGFVLPVVETRPYKFTLLNTIRYPALDYLSTEPKPEQYLSLGSPVRLIVDATLDLAGHQLITAPVQAEKNGNYVAYKVELSEQQGKVHYFADAFFANGLLNDKEMRDGQQELRSFDALLTRAVVIQ